MGRRGAGPGLTFSVGRRAPLGWLLRLVPRRLATSTAWARVTDPVARVVLRGVRTRGTAGGGRTETYGATDLHRVTSATGTWRGTDLGELAPVAPEPGSDSARHRAGLGDAAGHHGVRALTLAGVGVRCLTGPHDEAVRRGGDRTRPGGWRGRGDGAGERRLSVVGIDERLVGGECPYYGCIPSKMIIRAAEALQEGRRVEGLAGAARVEPTSRSWAGGASARRPPRLGRPGRGRPADRRRCHVRARPRPPHRPAHGRGRRRDVGGLARRGAQPRHVAGPPRRRRARGHAVLDQPRGPAGRDRSASMAVIGGGAIGAELAQAFSRFGTRVTVLERGDRASSVPRSPRPASSWAACSRRRGSRSSPRSTSSTSPSPTGTFRAPGRPDPRGREAPRGRRPPTQPLRPGSGDRGPRPVRAQHRGRRPDARGEGLWAIGDVAGHGAWTHMSMYRRRSPSPTSSAPGTSGRSTTPSRT